MVWAIKIYQAESTFISPDDVWISMDHKKIYVFRTSSEKLFYIYYILNEFSM